MFFRLSDKQAYKEVIALAAIFQAAAIVDELAKKGTVPEENFAASIASIFKINPESIEDIFDGEENHLPGLSHGFSLLQKVFDKNMTLQSDVLRYVLGLINLQGKLLKNKDMMAVMRSRLEQLADNKNNFDFSDDQIHSNLAGIYQDTLSNFRFRIQVNGNKLYLENPRNVDKIRALLLAGVRAALLWRQVGGKRWHLMLNSKQLRKTLETLL